MSFNAFGESPGANAIRWLALLPLGSSTMKRMIRDAFSALLVFLALAAQAAPPADTRRIDDLPYGGDPRQRMDVFLPGAPSRAPVLMMLLCDRLDPQKRPEDDLQATLVQALTDG